jgi:DNA-binding CsgD family transcriptional regulator
MADAVEHVELDHGRDAYERHAWEDALAHFTAADAAGALGPEDLVRFAYSSYWSGSLDRYLTLLERAYAAFVEADDRPQAAFTALMLQWDYLSKPAPSLANGWYRRAERILDSCPTCVAHGYLAQARVWSALDDADGETALVHARTMVELGREFHDRDLLALGIQRQGQALLACGDVAGGLGCLDEAVVAALSGELGTMTTAAIYCAAITCCRNLTDYERAGQWSDAVTRWCEREACTGFPGLCRIFTAELTGLRGDWARARQELERACTELQGFGALGMAADGQYQLGEVLRRMGDLDGAVAAYARSYEWGLEPQPGLALVHLARGETSAASAALARAMATPGPDGEGAVRSSVHPLRRARLLPARVQVALACGDLPDARAAAAELEAIAREYETKSLHAQACGARAQVALADEDLDAALTAATRSRTLWQELGMPYETARAHMSAAEVRRAAGDDESALVELRAAHSAFERLGARLDQRAAAALLGDRNTSGGDTLGLSTREIDVLRLVADGLTDGEIAERLFISPHTVHRHLANARTKTNLPSRAAVVALAMRHGLI